MIGGDFFGDLERGEGGEGFVENCKAWLRRGQRCPLGRCHVPKVCWEVVG